MKFRFIVLALAMCSQLIAFASSAQAAQNEFQEGSLRLKRSMFGQGIGGNKELNRLYNDRQWVSLVDGVVGKRFVSDLYYFYLGRGAEELGHPDAALVYYKLAVATHAAGDRCSFGFDSCFAVAMPGDAVARIEKLTNTELAVARTVTVVSSAGEPVAGVRVEPIGKSSEAACVTDARGSCVMTVPLKKADELVFVLSKLGMFPAKGTFAAGINEKKVTLPAFRDMLCEDLKTPTMASQATLLERQVETIFTRAKFEGASLEDAGICTSQFKQKRYLSFKLRQNTTFNENKLTNYAIGALVFDDVVRKMLMQMSMTASDMKVDGYDLSVRTMKRSFVAADAEHTSVHFQFYFPKQLVAKYQDKDISGQQLLDGSVVLLNDDRIDLKLQ